MNKQFPNCYEIEQVRFWDRVKNNKKFRETMIQQGIILSPEYTLNYQDDLFIERFMRNNGLRIGRGIKRLLEKFLMDYKTKGENIK
jgi:hypothetical protein